jgi:ribosome-associated translation inhibitor RaiA
MKLTLIHRHHKPSASFTSLIERHLKEMSKSLRIDEAHILIERQLEASPPFRMSAHLVTPGPDVFAEANDHTLRAALQKMVDQIGARINHRDQKRAQSARSHFKTASSTHFSSFGSRK